jgi:starch synthase
VWDPETDSYLDHHLKDEKVKKWKRKSKEALCEVFELDSEQPLFSFIGRLMPEKGGDLLAESFRQALGKHRKEMNVIILGSGTNEIEASLEALKNSVKGNYNCYIGYNEQLAHQIYAASDFLLMPSRVEPCGLNQMYAMRYGTIPIVRNVGGLRDTVIDFGTKNGFGIRFNQAEVWEVANSIDRAIGLFNDKDHFNDLRKRVMTFDHSWDSSAQQYIDLYRTLK